MASTEKVHEALCLDHGSRLIDVRKAIAAALVCGGLLASAGTAHAGCAPPQLKETIDTGGVLVHYTTDPGNANAISTADAQTLANNAQAALTDEVTKLGMPGPTPDDDGKQDVWVGTPAACALGDPDAVTVTRHPDQPTSDAFIVIQARSVKDKVAIAHELFHTMQMALMVGGRRAIREGTAEWAAHHLYPGQGPQRDYDPGIPLDCGDQACGTAPYDTWPFFEYLSERYGATIGLKIFQANAALGPQASAAQVLDSTLGPLGSNASAAYRDFMTALLGDRIAHPEVSVASDLALGNEFNTGVHPRRVRGRSFQLEHLSARFLDVVTSVEPGEGKGSCKPGLLALTIKAGAGAAAILRVKKHATAFRFKSGVGKATVKWPLCASTAAILAIINPNSGGPAQTFTVSAVVKAKR